MFCEQCGARLEEGGRFCVKCGAPIAAMTQPVQPQPILNEEIQSQMQEPAQGQQAYAGQEQFQQQGQQAYAGQEQPQQQYQQPYPGQVPYQQPQQPAKKGLPLPLLIGIPAAVLVVILILVIVLLTGRKINLNKYMEISAEGYNGYGTATYTFDYAKFKEDNAKKLKLRSGYSSYFGDAEDYIDYMSFYGEFDRDTELSNGDEITFTWDVTEEELEAIFKNNFKVSDITYKVEDLEEVETFDAFAGITVEFTGIDPEGYAEIVDTSTGPAQNLYFYLDKDYNLSNGDTVTVTISDIDTSYFAEQYGALPETMSKTYTVEGLGSYATALDSIPEDLLTSMKSQAEDVLRSQAAGDYSEYESLAGMEYLGSYFLSEKEGFNNYVANRIDLVYKVSVQISMPDYGISDTFSYYTYVCFDNIIIAPDGTGTVDLSDYETAGDRVYTQDYQTGNYSWSTTSFRYRGYDSLDTMYQKCVTVNLDQYNGDSDVSGQEGEAVNVSAAENTDYILPDSNRRWLTEDDLSGLSQEQLRLARNEIYARYGRKFDDEALQSYFDSKSWYSGTIESGDFTEDMLNATETYNRDFIIAYEEKMGYR